MTPRHYFNHAGCSLITARTKGAVVEQLEREEHLGSFKAEQAAASEMRALYALAGKAVGAAGDDMALTDSHTTGWTKALHALNIQSGDVLLTTQSEWGGNLKALHHLAHRVGAVVKLVQADERGVTRLEHLMALMTAKVKLISVTWLGSNGGHLEPAQAIGAVARDHGVPYFLDASQVVGQMPVDVKALGCDVLTTPGRKWLRGPKGTGLMYLRAEFLAQLQQAGAFDGLLAPGTTLTAKHFETPSTSWPVHMGLKAALEQFHALGAQALQDQILANTRCIWDGLRTVPQVRFLSDGMPQHGLLSFTVAGHTAAEVKAYLMAQGMEVAANQAAFTPLDMHARHLDAVVRVSAHASTAAEDLEDLVRALHGLCNSTPP